MNSRSAAWLLALVCTVALASAPDPPERVARVSYILGSASVQSAGAGRAESAAVNWPVTAGDRVRTDRASGAELDLGAAMLRLDQSTDLTLLRLDSNSAQIRIAAGAVSIQRREGEPDGALKMQFDRAAVELLQPGMYRIAAVNGATEVVVRTGAARISAGPARFQQFAAEQARIAPDGTVAITAAPAMDAFDQWSSQRARRSDGSHTALHVSKGLIGYEDLDAYGAWRRERDYGMVWEPRRVSREWAPYRFGQWIWKAPWGWTWVDDAPWGFAPFHSGRWMEIDTHWVWVPGPRQIPPVYAPALVGWTGNPAAHDRIDWFPLGPGEEYVPAYPASESYRRRLNLFATVDSHRALPASLPSESKLAGQGKTSSSRAEVLAR
jgi:hypothetical protein